MYYNKYNTNHTPTAMTLETKEYVKFQRSISRLLIWGVGIFPIVVGEFTDIVLLTPYSSLVSIVAGVILSRHATRVEKQET